MKAFITEYWHGITWHEAMTAVADVLIVAYIIYRVLHLLKGTRAARMLTGVVLVGSGLFVAKFFDLMTLSWLLDNLINYSILFFIIIFQHDIRRGLARVGQNLFGGGRQYEETFVFEEVIKAAEQLSRARMGGLIVFERDANLEEFFSDPGVVMDARVTKELLVALFIPMPDNTLHDGAVMLRNLRIHRAGVLLPLSVNPKLDKELGTRHRAAVGITEETDAVVVVVSEERGTISLCFGGNIARDLDGATLRKALLGLFQKPARQRAARTTRSVKRVTVEQPAAPAAVDLSVRAASSASAAASGAATAASEAAVPVPAALPDEAAVSHGAPRPPGPPASESVSNSGTPPTGQFAIPPTAHHDAALAGPNALPASTKDNREATASGERAAIKERAERPGEPGRPLRPGSAAGSGSGPGIEP